jgi:hypothetical protein
MHAWDCILIGSREATWHQQDLFRLPLEYVQVLARTVMSSEKITGTLSVQNDTLHFTPQTYLENSKSQKAEHLIQGKIPSIPLSEFPNESLPKTIHDKITDVQIMLQSPVITASGHAISSHYIGEQLSLGLVTAHSTGSLDLQSLMKSLPLETHSKILPIIKGEAIRRSKEADVEVFDTHVVDNSWYFNRTTEVREIAAKLASTSWEGDSYQKMKGGVLKTKLRSQMAEDLKLEPPLFNALTKDSQPSLLTIAQAAYASQLAILEEENEQAFKQFWISRVDDKCRLYTIGASSIVDAALRLQLEELLRTYIGSELVPAATARAKAKGLTKSSQLKLTKKVSSLESSLQQASELNMSMKALDDFNESSGISSHGVEDLQAAKRTVLQDMVNSMQKDQDAPRLFLNLLTIIIATKQNGVVYATGKNAPKLLKHIKSSLTSEEASRLEELKEGVKAGKITDVDREEMRTMATAAVNVFKP